MWLLLYASAACLPLSLRRRWGFETRTILLILTNILYRPDVVVHAEGVLGELLEQEPGYCSFDLLEEQWICIHVGIDLIAAVRTVRIALVPGQFATN